MDAQLTRFGCLLGLLSSCTSAGSQPASPIAEGDAGAASPRNPAWPDAPNADSRNTNDAGPGAPTDAGNNFCSHEAPPSIDACFAVLSTGEDHKPSKSCDAGFHAHDSTHVECFDSRDLRCAMRRLSWGHAPVHDYARPEEFEACRSECERGNGASCARLGKAFNVIDRSRTDLRARCALYFREEACRLGLPFACPEQSSCPDLIPSQREAFTNLTKACDRRHASWQCFYAAHAREMGFGTAFEPGVKKFYREICATSCPTSPERCYKRMACEVVRFMP